MEQHPIPTNVSSYQFKLVGDMTLKQFFQLAGGIVVGLLFYSSPLLPIIKFPLAIISILLGIGLAFLPFEERPLEKWIMAFFRAIYSPTLFNWQLGSVSAQIFQPETTPENMPIDPKLHNYLSQTNQVPQAPANLDKAESGFLAKLSGIFSNLPLTNHTPTSSPRGQIISMNPVNPSPNVNPPTPPINPAPLNIPANIPTGVAPSTNETPIQTAPIINPLPSAPAAATNVSQVVAGNEMISTHQAMFSIDAAPPNPPTTPNVVVGQIIEQDRHVVEGAIMEIRDDKGRPIRALRSNKVGHFITVTQLDNGHYEIIIEKDGYEFAPVSFDANGSIIPPILIQGKRLSPLLDMPAVPVKPTYSIN